MAEKSSNMEHLTCFVPGMLMLGVYRSAVTKRDSTTNGVHWPKAFVRTAEVGGRAVCVVQFCGNNICNALTETCVKMYRMGSSGLSPESVDFLDEPARKKNHARKKEYASKVYDDMFYSESGTVNQLRPETVESLYYMWYFTRNEKYRKWGREIFDAFERQSKAKYGYAVVEELHVDAKNGGVLQSERADMESFWVGETLKYFLLLFSPPETLDLSRYVLTTEAHPLRVF